MNSNDLQSKTKPSTISLPERVDKESKDLAEKLGVSRSSLIAALLDISCGNEPKTNDGKAVFNHLSSLMIKMLRLSPEQIEAANKRNEFWHKMVETIESAMQSGLSKDEMDEIFNPKYTKNLTASTDRPLDLTKKAPRAKKKTPAQAG